MNFYALKENSDRKAKPIPISQDEAGKYNRNGFGIYWTFNEFIGFGRRLKEELTAITAFFIEIDKGPKLDMQEKIKKSLAPSLVVETGRGYHLYWYLDRPLDTTKEPVKFADAYRRFLVERILPVYDGDPQAADACRLLRVPMYRYWKDPSREIYIDISYENESARYTLDEMERAFPVVASIEGPVDGQGSLFEKKLDTKDFWYLAGAMNNMEALRRLSGSLYVMGEKFDFKKDTSGFRILVNGKPINAWIDRDGKIGSVANGGPTIVNWLHYYGHSFAKVAEILKEVFPELNDGSRDRQMAKSNEGNKAVAR